MNALVIFISVLLTLAQATPVEKVVSPTTSNVATIVHVPLTQAVVAHVIEVKKSTVKPTSVPKSDIDVEPTTTEIMTTEMPTTTQPEDPCDLECTKMDLNPVCASNEHCVHEFPNECVMLVYNCRHAPQTFTIFKNEACENELLTRMAMGGKKLKAMGQQHEGQHHQPLHPSQQRRCTPEDLNGFIAITKP